MTAPRFPSPTSATTARQLAAELERVREERDQLMLQLHAAELARDAKPPSLVPDGAVPPAERELLASMGQNSVAGVQVFDLRAGCIIATNARQEELTGYALAELRALSPAEARTLVHPDDLALVRRSLHELGVHAPRAPGQRASAPVVYRYRHKSGAWLWLQAHHAPLERDEQGRLVRYMTSFIDITGLVAAREAATHFGQLAAHDLRAPARRIRQYVEMIGEHLPEGLSLPEVEAGLEGIDRQARRLHELARGMHILTTLRSPDEREDVVLDEVVDEVLEAMLGPEPARARPVERPPLPTVPAYPSLVGRIYAQLLENALQHSTPGTVIRFTCARRAREWVLGVETQGPTVPAELLEALFQPFRQGKADGMGTGLGLAICRRAVEAHGGQIWMESTAGRTHVRFTLRTTAGQAGMP